MKKNQSVQLFKGGTERLCCDTWSDETIVASLDLCCTLSYLLYDATIFCFCKEFSYEAVILL